MGRSSRLVAGRPQRVRNGPRLVMSGPRVGACREAPAPSQVRGLPPRRSRSGVVAFGVGCTATFEFVEVLVAYDVELRILLAGLDGRSMDG